MYPIQRQADIFGAFEPQNKPERTAAAAQSEIADLLRGPSIMAGLNVRHKEAVDTRGMDPDEHAYHEIDPRGYGTVGEWGQPELDDREYSRYEDDAQGVGRDDASGYNWGPQPRPEDIAGPGMDPNFRDGRPLPFDTPTYNPGGGYDDHP